VGSSAADALAHKHEARARALLEWYFGQHEPDGQLPTSRPGLVVWRQTHDLALTIAAMRPYEDDAAALALLEKARQRATDRDLKGALDSTLLYAQSYMGGDSLPATLARMHADEGLTTTSLRPFEATWRGRRGELTELDKLLSDANIPAAAKGSDYARAAIERARLGKFQEAYATYLRADSFVPLTGHDANNAAWYGMLAGHGGDARVLTLARRAATGGQQNELHTLATIEAGYADTSSAVATIAKWKGTLGRAPMRPVHALPLALLAERHGLVDEAIRLLEPIARDTSPQSAGAFARQRLEALRKNAPAGSGAVSVKAEMP
jgi:hypothetical protein